MAQRSYLLVDGHSIIHAWDELRCLHSRTQYLARAELVSRLTAYQDMSEDYVIVVFDGRGERVSEESEQEGVQIFYADKDHTADDIIERLVAKYAKDHHMTVATNDGAEQMTVTAFGGYWISADGLLERLNNAESAIQRELKSKFSRPKR